jgi:Cd2+/Zn2+-exporting ATPase
MALDPEWSEEQVLFLAASAERLSEHPLAAAIVNAAIARGLALEEAHEFRSISGKGIVAHVDGHEVVVGNEPLFHELGLEVPERAHLSVAALREEGKTAMLVGDHAQVRGVVAVADTLRSSAPRVVADLKRLDIEHVVMLTGDNHRVGKAIGAELGISEVRADLLPEQKLTVIRELQKQAPVAMVGDGVNDAPALATATIGVAMGGAGTDVALETADVVLMADDLSKLPYAIALSRRTRRTIIQNLTFALCVIVVLVTSALTIGIPLPLGVVGHEGSTIIVVLNGLRLLRVNPMKGL